MKKLVFYVTVFLGNGCVLSNGLDILRDHKSKDPCDALGVSLAKVTQALSNEKKDLEKFHRYHQRLKNNSLSLRNGLDAFQVNGTKEMRDQGNTLAMTHFIQEVTQKDMQDTLWASNLLQQEEQNTADTGSILEKERQDILKDIQKTPGKKCKDLLRVAQKFPKPRGSDPRHKRGS